DLYQALLLELCTSAINCLAPFASSGRSIHPIIFFFFQAEDGIRDRNVTGVQTCALPIYLSGIYHRLRTRAAWLRAPRTAARIKKIGRASCRERVYNCDFAVPL